MKLEITEKQLKTIAATLKTETDIDEQDEPVSAEPKAGTSEKQSGGDGYPEVGIWKPDITRGPDNQIANTVWHKDGAGSQITRGKANQLKECVFNAHITTNGRFIIIEDNVFDIKEEKGLGNLWESMDTFKIIFKETDSEEEGYKKIQESILNLPILENQDSLKVIKQVLLEQNWVQRQWDSTKKGVSDTAKEVFSKDTWDKTKKVLNAVGGAAVGIPQGDWEEILNLIKQGALYVVRKLRQAMYSTVGMVVDGILVATGIGKAVPFVVWSLIVGLDIYELTTGDYEDEMPMWLRYVQLGGDVLGMVFTGAVSKSVRGVFKGATEFLKGGGKMAQYLAKYPTAKAFITKMLGAFEKAPSFMMKALKYLQRKAPKFAKFLERIVKGMSKIFSKIKNAFKKMIEEIPPATAKAKAKAGAVAGAVAGGLAYGFEAAGELWVKIKTGLSPTQQRNINAFEEMMSVEPEGLFD